MDDKSRLGSMDVLCFYGFIFTNQFVPSPAEYGPKPEPNKSAIWRRQKLSSVRCDTVSIFQHFQEVGDDVPVFPEDDHIIRTAGEVVELAFE